MPHSRLFIYIEVVFVAEKPTEEFSEMKIYDNSEA